MSILWLAAICAALGIGCLLTPWHIGMTGVCLLLLAAVMTACHFLRGEKGKRWRRVLWSLAALGMALVFGMMGFIALDGRDNAPEEDVPFVVVLGAQTHGDRPSRTLRERLDLAADYLEAHPAARVIVSGGQGADETQTEASVMAAYLTAAGIDPDRIAQETQSENTRENLRNAAELAELHGLDASRVLIVTSEFHLRRASYIAGTLGLDASRLGSRTTPYILRLNYELREVFALVKAMYVAARA